MNEVKEIYQREGFSRGVRLLYKRKSFYAATFHLQEFTEKGSEQRGSQLRERLLKDIFNNFCIILKPFKKYIAFLKIRMNMNLGMPYEVHSMVINSNPDCVKTKTII
jgi:hypothetical protein